MVSPIVEGVGEVVDTVGDFVDSALEAGGNFIEALASTKFKGSGTLNGTGGNDLLVGIEFKSIGKFLELSFGALFSKEFWSSGTLPSSVSGYAGNNSSGLTINGGGGNDTIFSFGGSVTQNGGSGNDNMLALGGITTMRGDGGNDFMVGASLIKNTMVGGSGNDTIIALGATNVIYGSSGDDFISVVGGANFVDGGFDDDVILALGLGGNDLQGRNGRDFIIALGGLNFVRGNEDNDTLAAAGGANFMYGGTGTDTIIAIGGGNWIYGDADNGNAFGSGAGENDGSGAAKDIIVSFGVGNFIWSEGGNDIVTAFGGGTFVDSGSGDDVVVAIGGGNILFGGANDDVLVASGSINAVSGQDGDDVIVTLGTLDLGFGGAGDDIMISVGPTIIGFQLGDTGQDIMVAVGGSLRIMFGDDPFGFVPGGDGDDDAKRDGLIGFAEQTLLDFQFTDFEFEDLSLPTLPTFDDLDEGALDVLENFILGTWEGIKSIGGNLAQIPSLFNGDTLSLDRLETAFTAIELPDFTKPDFGSITLDALSPFNIGSLSFDSLDAFSTPASPNYNALDVEALSVDGIDEDTDIAFGSQSIFTPESGIGDIGLPDFNSMLPNLSSGFDASTVGGVASYFSGDDTDTSGLPSLSFANLLDVDNFGLPDAGGLLTSIAGVNLPDGNTLSALGSTLSGLFSVSSDAGLIQPGEGRGDFALPDLSLPNLSVPSFDLFSPQDGDDSDIMVSVAGASLMFGQEDDDILVGAGLMNLQFGGAGSDILAAIAKGNVISGGQDDDIAVGIGLLNLISGGEGSDILGAAGKFNIVAGGTDGDILVAGGLANLMLGGSGSDIVGGVGKLNVIAAGADDDILVGGGKFNVSMGGAGDDLAFGLGSFNLMLGGVGNDFMIGGGKLNAMFGGDDNDIMLGGGKFNIMDGDLGDDLMIGGGKFNLLYARSGNDALIGGGTFNTMIAGQGTDLVLGGGKFNLFMSGTEADSDEEDHDIVFVAGKYNTFLAGGGDDLAFVGGELNHVFMGTGQDIVIAFASKLNMVFAQEEADLVFGAGIGNLYSGGTGNDLMFGFGRDEPEGNGEGGGEGEGDGGGGSSSPNIDIRSDGTVDLRGDWGDDLLIGVGENLIMKGGEGQDKLLAGGGLSFLSGQEGYDTIVSLLGLSALDGGDGNDILYSKGTLANIGLPSITQIAFDGGDVQGGKGSDLIWANGTDIEVFGDTGVSIFSPEEAPDVEDNRDRSDGDDYIIISGENSEAYGQAGDDAMILFGVNHRALGGEGNDLMIALGRDTELIGGAGDDEIINMGGRLAWSQGGEGDDIVLGKGYALFDWMLDRGGDVVSEFGQNILLFAENIGEIIGNTYDAVTSFRGFDGSEITTDHIYTGRDGLGVIPEDNVPDEQDIRDQEIATTTSHIFTLIDTYGVENLGSVLSEIADPSVPAFAPSYDTLAGDVTQAGAALASPFALGVNALAYQLDLTVADMVAASAFAPIFRGGDDNDTLGGRLGLSSLLGGAGNDTYLKSVSERITIINEELLGGDDSLTIQARATDVFAFGLDGLQLSNLVFEMVDGQNDGGNDDLLIKVLSDGGEIRSVTILLDHYQAEGAIETLVLKDWLGNEQSFDLSTLAPVDVTLNASVDGTVLSALVDADETNLETELATQQVYNELFFYDNFNLDEGVTSDDGEDMNALESMLDMYFQTLGSVSGSSTVGQGETLEDTLNGSAFDGAPVLEVDTSGAEVFFDEGALLRIKRTDDNGQPRYESELTSNGSSEGFKSLHIFPTADAPFMAEARDDLTIHLSGPDAALSLAELSAEMARYDFGLDPLGAEDGTYFGKLTVQVDNDTDLTTPLEISGDPANGDPAAWLIDADDLAGMRVSATDAEKLLIKGAVDFIVTGETRFTVDSSFFELDAQTVEVRGNVGFSFLGGGENIFNIYSGSGTLAGALEMDTFNVYLGDPELGMFELQGETAGAGDLYRFISADADAALPAELTIRNKTGDVIDFSLLSEDIFVVPLSNGIRLKNAVSEMNIRLTDLTALPDVIWTDGVQRSLFSSGDDQTGTGADEAFFLRATGSQTGYKTVDAGDGDDLIFSGRPNSEINPGLGDDFVRVNESPLVGTPVINWEGGNDHYVMAYQNSDSLIDFTLGTFADYAVVPGLNGLTVTYLPTGEMTVIEGMVTEIIAGDTSLFQADIDALVAQVARITDEDVALTLFTDTSDLDIPAEAEFVNVRVTGLGGSFVTSDDKVIATGDMLTVAEYLSLSYVPAPDFNTVQDGPFVLEAEFLSATGGLLKALDVNLTVNPVSDPIFFGFEGGTDTLVLNEGEVPENLPFIFSDPDGLFGIGPAFLNLDFFIGANTSALASNVFGGTAQEIQQQLLASVFSIDENDSGLLQFSLNGPNGEYLPVVLEIQAVDDLEVFVDAPADPLELSENTSGDLYPDIQVLDVDGDTNLYEIVITYDPSQGFIFASWDFSDSGWYLHEDGATLEGQYNSNTGIETRTLTGTLDQINSSIGEIRVSGNSNFEGTTVFSHEIYKIEADDSRTLQGSYDREVTFTKGINQVIAESGRTLYMMLDSGPVEVGLASPFDEDFALDMQPVFPVLINRLPEWGHLEKADGTVIGLLDEITSDELTSLLYVPDPLGPNEDPREWNYDTYFSYLVYNPAGNTTVREYRVGILAYDDKNEVDDGQGGTTIEAVGFTMFNRNGQFGTSNSIFFGGIGDDTFIPNLGVDMMLGGLGADTFVINEDAGEFNVIGDFELGVDSLDFGELVVVDISELAFFDDPDEGLVDTTIDTVLTLSNGSFLVLEDVTDFIENQNIAPNGVQDMFEVGEFTYFMEAAPSVAGNVLANDFDDNGDAITIDLSSVVHPLNGSLEIAEDGTFTYRPDRDFSGTDMFSYRPTDGTDIGRVVDVFITVTDDPNNGDATFDELSTGDLGGALAGNDGFDTLIGGLLDDILVGGAEADTITTGAGFDQILGTLTELDGDLITDFTVADVLVIQGARLPVLDVSAEGDNTELTFTQDGVSATLTLAGLFPDVQFVQSLNADGDTELRILPLGVTETVLSDSGDRFVAQATSALTIFAGLGNDAVAGGSEGDILIGGAGADFLTGGDGADILIGGAGQNTLEGGTGPDVFVIDISDFSDLTGTGSAYELQTITDFTPGEDIIELSGFGDLSFETFEIVQFLVQDLIRLTDSGWLLLEGVETSELSAADFRFVDAGLASAATATGNLHILTEGADTFVVSSEGGSRVEGLAGNDLVLGGNGADVLLGGLDDDTILGRDGADEIDGGPGNNTLTGGAGPDVFVISDQGGLPGRDIITDFALGVDSVRIDGVAGITSIDDLVRTDTADGLEFDLGGGRSFVLAGYTSTEEFSETDIEVIPGAAAAAAASAAAPLAAAPAALSATAAVDDPVSYDVAAWSVAIGDFEAARNFGFNLVSFELEPSITITITDEDGIIDPNNSAETSVKIGDDDQGALTNLFYYRLSERDENGNATDPVYVAVLERANTADYLLIPFDPDTNTASTEPLPEGVELRSFSSWNSSNPVRLVSEVIANGGILSRDDTYTVDVNVPTLLDVLVNDEDASGDPLQIISVTQPSGGTVQIVGDRLEFLPDEGFVGSVSFEYTIADGTGLEDTGLVEITVAPLDFNLVEGSLDSEFLIATANPDYFIGSGGDDTIVSQVAFMDGDIFSDFNAGDQIFFTDDGGVGPITMTTTGTETIVQVGDDGTGAPISTFTLLGDFSEDIFRLAGSSTGASIRFASDGSLVLTDADDRFVTTDIGTNIVYGSDGGDVIITGDGVDVLSGGDGEDLLIAGSGADFLFGGKGADILTGGADGDGFYFDISDFEAGGFAANFITDFEVGVDTAEFAGFGITSFDEAVFVPLATGDALQLGTGQFVVFEGLTAADLSADDFTFTDAGRFYQLQTASTDIVLTDSDDRLITTDPLSNDISGGVGNDVLLGADGADLLRGGPGEDLLVGGQDDDILIGGQGADRLTGGTGADDFLFTLGEETGFAAEFITDFEVGADQVILNGFGLDENSLAFQTLGGGQLALSLTASHFIVFEGFSAVEELGSLEDAFVFG